MNGIWLYFLLIQIRRDSVYYTPLYKLLNDNQAIDKVVKSTEIDV